MPNPHDSEIVLTKGDLHLRVSPYGASLRGLWRTADDGTVTPILTAYSGADSKVGGQGDVLIPFPGRIKAGRYEFQGEAYQMELSDKEGPNAIHGFVRKTVWDVAEQTWESITFATAISPEDHPGYPFALAVRVQYRLAEDGMTARFEIVNPGDGPAPVAAGFHPYFEVGGDLIDTATLAVPFAATLEYEELVPTGRVLPVDETELDFRTPHPIGGVAFNTCYVQPIPNAQGRTEIVLSEGGRRVTVWMDRAFPAVVLYSGDPLPDTHARKSLAIEPMTAASDSFNHPDWGLTVLEAGDTFSGAWGVRV